MTDKGKGKEKTQWWKKSVRFDTNSGGDEHKARAAMNYRDPSQMGGEGSPMSGTDDQTGADMSVNDNGGSGMSRNDNGGGIILRGLGGEGYKTSGTSGLGGKDYKHSGMGGMDPKDYKAAYLRGISGTNKPQASQPPATKHSKDTVEHRYQKALAKDPQSYSLSATTVHQQAAQESNFIGSAYFYNADIVKVQWRLAGDYVVVYARPKHSRTYPRGSAVQTFEPDFKNRITIYTEVPRDGGVIDDERIKMQKAEGSWGVGALLFNGAKIALYFDDPDPRTKSYAEVRTETYPDEPSGTGLLDKVLFMGANEAGSNARFGIKDMIFENNTQYGFEFIDLSLSVWNQITGEKDQFTIVAVKMPRKGNVASAFILKQPIRMPPQSWFKWQRHVTRDQNKLSTLVRNIENVVSDWYDSGNEVMNMVEEDREELWKGLWGEKPAK